MQLQDGQTIKIKKDDSFIEAKILHKAWYSATKMWWIEYFKNDVREVTVFDEKDLIAWQDYKCKCGSAAAGQSNRHSYYCDLYEEY